ncbi:MAG TPA: hypothetical protein VHV49_08755, partial [Pseudonocardiaceae bacterium]|nr:hypothetical protein [Pseudonocardiaceae bacterium]
TGVEVWLVHGPGGQGKTRVAHHLGEELAAIGWAVQWLDLTADAGQLAVLAETVVPVLVVVDYAESRTEQLPGGPAHRAVERDEDAVVTWRREAWPAGKR